MTDPAAKTSLDRDHVLETILFGSVARGEAGPDSDIDLLVEIEEPFGLLKVAEVQNFFEDLLGSAIDVVPTNCLDRRIEDKVHRDLIRAA